MAFAKIKELFGKIVAVLLLLIFFVLLEGDREGKDLAMMAESENEEFKVKLLRRDPFEESVSGYRKGGARDAFSIGRRKRRNG